jgi:phosphinothricin acetyltransferase
LVATINNSVVGWAALSPVSSRCVYGGVAELSVYTSDKHRGKGVGKKLLQQLIAESETNGIWTLQAGIFQENEASVKLHEGVGFRIIGIREKIGKLKGTWRNNYILERRSKIVGIE